MSGGQPQSIVLKVRAEVEKIDPTVLFVIAKSSNRNVVVYSYVDAAAGGCRPYWLMFEKTKNNCTPTEGLNFMENNLAYGVSITTIDATTFKIVVVGYPKMNFEIRNKHSFVEIDGLFHSLIGMYVHQSPGYFSTSIDGVTVVYGSPETPLCRYVANS